MNRVAVVIGAARGIGAATTRLLAEAGWSVMAVDRGSDDPRLPYALGSARMLGELAAEAGSAAHPVVARIADTCDEPGLAAAVGEAEARFGGVDAVITAAGVIAGGVPLWEMPAVEVDAVLDVDLRGVVVAARVGIPALLRRPEPRAGRFLAVSSTAASRGLPMLAAYGAAKAGVTGLVRGLAAELRGTGITANSVSPGSTATPILDESARLYGLDGAEVFARQHTIERLIRPEEVAGALAWLAGPAGAAVTGVDLPVDGGLAL
ncbi:MAG: mycofactocin-coupled SDR family oxidoreductase [Acidimicrobiales bacterium]